MAKKRYKSEEIVTKLRQVEVLQSQGMAGSDAIRQIGVSEVTQRRIFEWRDILYTYGSEDSHRTMASPLQNFEASQFFEFEISCS